MCWAIAINYAQNLHKLWLQITDWYDKTFLDIYKVFDKVWHEDLVSTLQTYDVHDNLQKLLQNYITSCQQNVLF